MYEIISLSFLVLTNVLLIFWLRSEKKKSTNLELLNREHEKETILLKSKLENTEQNRDHDLNQFRLFKSELENHFRGLAAQALDGNNKQFLELAGSVFSKTTMETENRLAKNESHLLNLIQPLSSALLELNKKTQELEKDRVSAFSSLDNEIKRVITTNQTLANETMALKNALKKPHVRGRWGEVQLKNCIDLAGMSEYCDVSFQHVTNDLDEQQRYIPDMVVRMPGGRNVVVDAKTPLEAFITALESADDSERALQMARHGRHVKEHVKKLSTKDYASVVKGSADFTVLFLPNESFLYAALESEPQLMEFALERKILIATPPTLIGLLKVISYGWNEEKLAENAARISEVGIELHKRVCDFVETYENVGKYLSKAHEEFEAGQTRLNSRVIVQAKKLERLGAKSKKDLPMIEGFEDSSLVEADDSLA